MIHTEASAIKVPRAAPTAPDLGIKTKLITKFIIAPNETEIQYCLSF